MYGLVIINATKTGSKDRSETIVNINSIFPTEDFFLNFGSLSCVFY